MASDKLDDLFNNIDVNSIDNKLYLLSILKYFTEIEQTVFILYLLGYTQYEIGIEVGYSQRQVGRIILKMSKMCRETPVISEGNNL